MSEELAAGYPVDRVNRVKRRQDRGFYDYATVHALLDAERLPIRTQIGTPEPCPRLRPHVVRPPELDGYRAGRSLEAAVAESHLAAYPNIENRS
jgi:hypothetical protein